MPETWKAVDERGESLLVHQEWLRQEALYNIPVLWRFQGSVDDGTVVSALHSVIEATPALRNRYRQDGERFYVAPGPVAADVVEKLDISHLPDDTRDTELDLITAHFARQGLDLERRGPLRAQVIRYSASCVLVQIVFHHICMDEEAFEAVEERILRALSLGSDGEPLPDTQPTGDSEPVRPVSHEVAPGDAAYWADRAPSLPTGPKFASRRPGRPTGAGAVYRAALGSIPPDVIAAAAATAGLTPQALLFGALAMLVHRETRLESFTIGTPVSVRTPAEAGKIGHFVNTVPVPCAVSGAAPAAQVLGNLWQAELDSIAHSSVPLEGVLAHRAAQDRSELVTVLFGFHRSRAGATVTAPGVDVTRTNVDTGTAKFEQTWSVYVDHDGTRLELEYDTGLYDEADVALLADHYEHLVAALCAQPRTAVAALPLMSARERAVVLERGRVRNASTLPTPVPDLIGAQARRQPHRTAVSCGGRSLTYAELDRLAERIAAGLAARGVRAQTRVGVRMGRSTDLVATLLGVLRTGGCYVALDPSYPDSRVRFVAEDSGIGVIVTDDALRESVPVGAWETSTFEELSATVAACPPRPTTDPGSACYMIYTSGSTGSPKGVVVTHENLARLFETADAYFAFQESDVWGGFHSYAFDVSAWEIWGSLSRGARLVLSTDSESRDLEAFHRLVVREEVTILSQTPTAFIGFEAADRRSGLETRLRSVIFAGEALDHPSVARWTDRHGWERPRLVNMYGITETTVHSTLRELTAADLSGSFSVIGHPLPDVSAFVLDEEGEPCALGVPGELYIGGAGVTRGYLGSIRQTADRYVPDHLTGEVGSRIYRSGDRARWLPDDGLQYLGRADSMLKIRGFRIEPAEVEHALGRFPGVVECAVAGRQDGDSGTVLVGYVVMAGTTVTTSELRRWMKSRVPEYLVPSIVLFLAELPRTPSGKLDRAALPAIETARPRLDREFEPPRGEDEEWLAGVWGQVLGFSAIGRYDNYFDLGGDSIRSVRMLGLVRSAGYELTQQEIFDHPTLTELASALGEPAGPAGQDADEAPLVSEADLRRLPEDVIDAYPMAELQIGMVYEMERDLDRRPYHNVGSMRIHGPFDETAFRRALALVVRRHPILRTALEPSAYSVPLQLVRADAEMTCAVSDVRHLDEAAQQAAIAEYVRAERRHAFDHARPPLLRMGVHWLADDAFQWTVTEHHAIFDGWSLHSTLTEISGLYQRLLAGDDVAPQSPPASSYRDFIATEQKALRSAESERFWLDRVEDRPRGKLPRWSADSVTGLSPAAGDNEWRMSDEAEKHGAIETLLPSELCEKLLAFAQSSGVTLKSVLLAAHIRVLGLVTGSNDVLTGVSSNGRLEEAGGADTRGLFLNTLPFRFELSGGSWIDLVREVFQAEREVLPHRRYPLGALQRRLGIGTLLETQFVYLHFHVLADEFGAGRLKIVDGKIDSFSTTRSEPTNFPLSFGVIRNPYSTRLLLSLDYHLGELTEGQVALTRDYFVRVLEAMVADPGASYGDVRVLGPAESSLIESWAGGGVRFPVSTIHGQVVRRAVEAPDDIAVVCGDDTLTYAQLVTRAGLVAQDLRGRGVGAEVPVGVYVKPSVETAIATLGIMLAGGLYVPLDTAFPHDRVRHMLQDVQATLVLVDSHHGTHLPDGPWQTVDLATLLDSPDQPAPQSAPADLPPETGPDQPCYVIFTSGSTGRPKATTVTHANVTRLFEAVKTRLPFGPDDVWSMFHSFAFDFSVWEMWGALTTGGRLVIAPHHTTRDTDAFYHLIRDEHVTILSQTPSAFREFDKTDARTASPLALRAVLFGGEALDRTSVLRWADRHGYHHPVLINMYGITETTVHVTYTQLTQDKLTGTYTPIGDPLPDLRVHVLDAFGAPAPVGVTGELHIGGPGITRGYLNQPRLTAKNFTPDHLSGEPGARLYHSGDLARWKTDGTLEYLGRADNQVKIRGFRIELGEIDAELTQLPHIQQATTITHRNTDNNHTDLIAYLITEGATPSATALRDALADRLPAYMIPRSFVFLDALPLTPQGKLDRRALPAPSTQRPELTQVFVPPEPGVERTLAGIWAEVLDVDQVGRHDDYFRLGGDSIRSIQILGKARDAGLRFHLQDLFEHRTLARIAAVVERSGDESGLAHTQPFALVRAEDRARLPEDLDDAYPMAELQLGMVYEMERDPDRKPYLTVTSLRMSGPFEESSFRRAVSLVVQRHPVLRTSFALSGLDEPMQFVHTAAETPLRVTDLKGRGSHAQHSLLAHHVRSERSHGFDTTAAPLWRMSVHVLSDDVFQWTVTEHHAILDGWSSASTLAEITDTYHALLRGEDLTPPPLRSTYRDYIAAERAALDSTESAAYWHDLLADHPRGTLPSWPADRQGHPALLGDRLAGESHHHDASTGRGALVSLVPPQLVAELETMAEGIGVPLASVLLAAHLRVLGLVTGDTDVVTGLSSNGRLEETDGADARGLFLNSLPFRFRLPGGSWAELARAVCAAERASLPHRRYPMSALQRALGGEPLFEAAFVYTHFRQVEKLEGSGRATFSSFESHDGTAAGVARTSFPLQVAMSRESDGAGLHVELEYDARRFAAEQVRLLRDYHLRAFEALARTPDADHRRTDLLGAAEHALLASWNDTSAPVADTPVYELVAARAAAAPERTALVAGDRSLSYAELDDRANRLAHRLRGMGAGPEVFTGVCLERSPELIIALLAVLKSGGAYVAMDPDFPTERLEHMARQADAGVLLASPGTVDRCPVGPWRTVVLDETALEDDGAPSGPPQSGAGPDNACYAVFTSGSTGLPKGVVTQHRNVTELLHGGAALDLREDDTLLQIATAAFDVSTFEIWAPLAAGARLVLAPPGPYGPAEVAEWVERHGVTVLHATASLFAVLVDQQPQALDGLRKLLTGSETVSPVHAERAVARCPGLELVNCWGPTETTTFSVCGTFTAASLPTGPLPLGRPLANTEVWVLDAAGLPAPVGSPGELYVSGPCLARGYLGDPGLTAERFRPCPLSSHGSRHSRLYRTGDRGRWSADGQVDFLGRVDDMVKVRGYRVEPDEVAVVLGAHPRVQRCAVTGQQDAEGRTDLVAYVVADGDKVPVSELRSTLRKRLPAYMMPRSFVFLDALPLTPQGKLDRRALPAPSTQRPDVDVAFEPPLPGMEERLATVWRQVLGVERIGRHDNFFDLGGDSIRSIQILGKARDAGLAVRLQDLFHTPTLAALSQTATTGTLDEQHTTHTQPFSLVTAEDRTLLPEDLDDAYPMAELQLGMVYERERDPDRNPYHNVESLPMAGRFDAAAFRRALTLVTERHPVLRTSFDLSRFSEPMQLVRAQVALPLAVVDLREKSGKEQRSAVAAHVRAEERNAFPLTEAPLWRMSVHVLSEEAFQWTVTHHHAILDGWSFASTLAEITDTYHALLRGEDLTPPPLRSTYRDYIAAERAALDSTESAAYWHDLLADHPDGAFPRPSASRPNDDALGHGELSTVLPEQLCDQLARLATIGGVPVKTVLLAAHLRALSVAIGATDLVTGLSSNGRLETSDSTEVQGLFLNTVPLRLRLSGGSWLELLRAVFEAERETLPHRRYPMSALQRALGGEPLFETGFVYNHFRQIDELAGRTILEHEADDAVEGAGRTHFPLLVAVTRPPGQAGIRLKMQYDNRELPASRIESLRDYFVRVLEAMVADPGARYGEVGVLGARELSVIDSWVGGGVRFPVSTVHGRVVRRAVEAPDDIAVVCGGDALTYAELVTRAGRVAEYVRGCGVGVGVPVGVCVQPSLETAVATLGVMLAGGVYVPLDTAFPDDRIRFMLEDVGAALVLVDSRSGALVSDGPWKVVDLTTLLDPPDDPAPWTVADLPGEAGPDDSCYVIFTSGSTGRPKATAVTHGNVTRLFEAVKTRLAFGREDVWSMFHSFAFDFSVWEMWGALTTGGRLVIAPRDISRDTEAFYALVRDEAVTMLSQTPSAFRQFDLADAGSGSRLALRAVLFGGEALDRPSVLRWAGRHGYADPLLVNLYGITETTVHVTYAELTQEQLGGAFTPIGEALPDLRVHVLDAFGAPVPVGVTGELYIGGPGVSRGYLGRPGLTAQSFVPDHLGGEPGARLYRSGDLARRKTDGSLEYVGRVDNQVKIRGFRVELGEVEAELGRLPGIRQAVAITRDNPTDSRTDLIAYLVPEGATPSTTALRDALADRMPAYMIPRSFVFLDALPLTGQGKLDRRSLPAPTGERPDVAVVFEPPLPGVEEQLATVWRQVLGVERIGRHDNFFDLGGDSIRSIQILGKARDAGLVARLQDLFQAPTLAGLSRSVAAGAKEERQAAGAEPFALVTAEDRARLPEGLDDAYPMAELQLGMVYEMERDPERNPYHNVESLPMAGRFDAIAFRRALALVTERHAVLRTSLELIGYSEPMQLVHTAVAPPLIVVDLRGLGEAEQRSALRERVSTERANPFPRGASPLWRMSVHVLSEEAFQWTVTEHHAILDGWSFASTLAEITDTYNALLRDEDVTLSPLRSTYRDYIAAERAALDSTESAAYWHTLLADHPRDPLPWRGSANDGCPAGEAVGGEAVGGEAVAGETHERDDEQGCGVLSTPLPRHVLTSLQEFATHAGVPFKSAVLAAHLRAMTLVTGSTDVVTGLTANGRLEETDGSEARGMFLNTVPLRVRVPDGSWADLARAVFEAEREMLPHRRYPMSALRRRLGGGALFDVNFTYNDFSQLGMLAQSGAFSPESPGADVRGVAITNFPFSVTISRETASGDTRMDLEYDTRELTAAQVTRIRDYHLRALAAMASDFDADHRGAELMSGWERELLAGWHDSGVSLPGLPVHELLRRQARRTPDTVAVEDGEVQLTFAELDGRSELLARRLRRCGIRQGDQVGICLRPGATALIALWAVWKAGAAFVPLDPDLPAQRLRDMLEQASPVLVVTDVPGEVPEGYDLFDPTPSASATGSDDEATPLPEVGDHDLAYVMFTSGTSGRPKGVMIEHGSLSEYAIGTLAERTRSLDAPAPLRVVTGSSAYISDFFIEQVLLVLEGHTLCVLGRDERRDLRCLVEHAHDEKRAVDIVDTTTLQMQLLVEHGLLDAPYPPRLIVFGGEACPPDLWNRMAAHPTVRAVNSYGPTEATVEATLAAVAAGTTPVIGRPRPGTRVHVLDDAGNLVPPGSVGEIYLGGPGVGRGYLKRPALTAERFVPDPWGPAGGRLYRTGDLGRLSGSGELEYLGRCDQQLKVLGQRVEPEEVEAVLRAHPRVAAAAVGRRPGFDGLLAGIVSTDGRPVDHRELRRHASAHLPSPAVPVFYTDLDALPRTVVGKLDRGALRMREDHMLQGHEVAEAARPVEQAPRAAGIPRTADDAGQGPAGTERRISEIWERILGLRVSRDDDFFLAGGHSLSAVRLVGELSAAFDLDVRLAELYDKPTVAGQAEYVNGRLGLSGARRHRGNVNNVLPLGGTTGSQPLVLVHPLGGTVFCYLELVSRVSDSFEILGVQADPLGGGGTADFAATARQYADELAPLMAGRRPVIAGWSAGGVLAHEVACRLSALGVAPQAVVIVDAAPDPDPEDTDEQALERLRAAVAERGLKQVLADGSADGLLELLGAEAGALAGLSEPIAASLMEFWQTMLAGLAAHRPSVFDGPVHLVVSRRGTDEARRTAVTGWQRLAGELRVSLADGDHYQLMREPWVADVAEAVTGAKEAEGA